MILASIQPCNFNGLQPNSLLIGTGNFFRRNGEFTCRNREFSGAEQAITDLCFAERPLRRLAWPQIGPKRDGGTEGGPFQLRWMRHRHHGSQASETHMPPPEVLESPLAAAPPFAATTAPRKSTAAAVAESPTKPASGLSA